MLSFGAIVVKELLKVLMRRTNPSLLYVALKSLYKLHNSKLL